MPTVDMWNEIEHRLVAHASWLFPETVVKALKKKIEE